MKTKLIGSVSGIDKSIDELINEWISNQNDIEIVDIKFQSMIAKTEKSTLIVVNDALIIYKEHKNEN